MDPITAALITAGSLKVAGGIASGVGQARAAKKMMLTPAEERQLRELEKLQQTGQLGLAERERGLLEQQFLTEQAGAQRELEAAALQQAAARGLGGATSGREIFLQEQAEVQAEKELRQQQNLQVAEMDRAQAAAQKAQIEAMRTQQKAAEAQRAQGIANAFSLGFGAAGDTAAQYAQMANEAEIARIQAEIQAGKTGNIQNELETTGGRAYQMGTVG